jgi:hypothetical protein
MNIAQLRKILALQEQHCIEDGDREKADAIASFANLLEGNDQMSVPKFVERVSKALKHAGMSPGRATRRQR